MAWLYVPGLEDWNSDCDSSSESNIELCVTSSGKPTLRPLSWRGWKTRPWMKRLYGTILRPSMAGHGVISWIWLVWDCRASRIALRGSGMDTRITERFGRFSYEAFPNPNLERSSSKTSLHSLNTSNLSMMNYKDWVSSLRRPPSSPRKNVARRISADDSLFLLPTPSASRCGTNHGGAAGRIGGSRPGLETLVESIPTCGANDWKGSSKTGQRRGQLDELVENLPTPRVFDAENRSYKPRPERNMTSLSDTVLNFPAPTGDLIDSETLSNQPAPKGQRRGRLNPLFSEWVMGLPIGWTDGDASVTESYQLWLQQHSTICEDK